MTDDKSLISNNGWQIGLAIEAGIDEVEARRMLNAGELAALAGVATGGSGAGAVAAGIGALTAVGAPAAAAGGLGYTVASVVSGIGRSSRDQLLRILAQYFGLTGQEDKVIRLFEIEGKGRLVDGRHPPNASSTKALLEILGRSESRALVGLFGSPDGKFVMTLDLNDGRYAYMILANAKKFSGGGIDSRGEEFDLNGVSSIELLIRILEREGFLQYPENFDDEDELDM